MENIMKQSTVKTKIISFTFSVIKDNFNNNLPFRGVIRIEKPNYNITIN